MPAGAGSGFPAPSTRFASTNTGLPGSHRAGVTTSQSASHGRSSRRATLRSNCPQKRQKSASPTLRRQRKVSSVPIQATRPRPAGASATSGTGPSPAIPAGRSTSAITVAAGLATRAAATRKKGGMAFQAARLRVASPEMASAGCIAPRAVTRIRKGLKSAASTAPAPPPVRWSTSTGKSRSRGVRA